MRDKKKWRSRVEWVNLFAWRCLALERWNIVKRIPIEQYKAITTSQFCHLDGGFGLSRVSFEIWESPKDANDSLEPRKNVNLNSIKQIVSKKLSLHENCNFALIRRSIEIIFNETLLRLQASFGNVAKKLLKSSTNLLSLLDVSDDLEVSTFARFFASMCYNLTT